MGLGPVDFYVKVRLVRGAERKGLEMLLAACGLRKYGTLSEALTNFREDAIMYVALMPATRASQPFERLSGLYTYNLGTERETVWKCRVRPLD